MLFLSVFSLVFLAELGDKTQLLMMSLSSRYGVLRIVLGVLPAIVLLSLLATGVGGILSSFLSAGIIRSLSAAAFLVFALLCLRSEKERERRESRGSVLFIFFTFFLAELGDKTQFSVIASSATALPGDRWQVALGGIAGLLLADAAGILGTPVPEGVKCVAYRTVNGLTNDGDYEWTKETGMPSVWLLGMFNPTPTTVVFIPYNEDYDGRKVNDEYFGKIPSDRLVADNGILYFKIDGKFRSKLGLPEGSARDVCGSYDYAKGVLTIIKYTLPEDGNAVYVNGQWGPQEDPYSGDVINAYNDGPTEDGTVMGPFYEMETSSPAAALKPGETLSHIQTTMHFSGAEDDLDILAREIFGTSLKSLSGIFNL